jgi:hypothetical protein
MFKSQAILKVIFIISFSLFLTNCGGGLKTYNDNSDYNDVNSSTIFAEYNDENISVSQYKLTTLSDAEFNALSTVNKRQVADKLLSTLFFGYPLKTLEEKIASGSFISSTLTALDEDRTDKAWLENHILDENIYRREKYGQQGSIDILTRFYAMKELDKYFIHNWTAYILSQTIMFSPAYELDSTHVSNIDRVYNRLVRLSQNGDGIRHITYEHMISEDNWRRFRSPEDNGREMLEIFLFDMDDSHVPLAGKALKNWKLDDDGDTLVQSLNENREPVKLFDTNVTNGFDFYEKLVKSKAFSFATTKRLVDFFFSTTNEREKVKITNTIVSSKPEKWKDVLLQIVFSEEYLLHSSSPKSAEEIFFSTTKKMNYNTYKSSIFDLKYGLEKMRQASMKYKLGKLKRVPLDTLSFANVHTYMRTYLFKMNSRPKLAIERDNDYYNMGWDKSFIANEHFNLNEADIVKTLDSFVQYLFHAIIARDATKEELSLFRSHMIDENAENKKFTSSFNLFYSHADKEKQSNYREIYKTSIAMLILDYISRLSETYEYQKVK